MARPTNEELIRRKRKAQREARALAKQNSSTDVTKTDSDNGIDVDLEEIKQELDDDVREASGINQNEDAVLVEEQPPVQQITSGETQSTEVVISDSNAAGVPEDEKFDMGADDVDTGNDIDDDVTDIDNIPDGDFDPLVNPVKERDYTGGGEPKKVINPADTTNPNNIQQPIVEEIIPEPIQKEQPIDDVFPEDDKKKDTGGGGNKGGSTGTGTTTGDGGKGTGDGKGTGGGGSTEPKRENPNPKLDDLSPKQKREAAEKTADVILVSYKTLLPIVPKKLSSFNMRKLQIMEMKDELDMSIKVVGNNGTEYTVKDYCENVNQQVEQTFVITDEMIKEIKAPLVDVLLENNLALTATQRLMVAVGGQIIQMGFTTFEFIQQNKNALNEFKRFHTDNREERMNVRAQEQRIREEEEAAKKKGQYQQYQNTQTTQDTTQTTQQKAQPKQEETHRMTAEPDFKVEEHEEEEEVIIDKTQTNNNNAIVTTNTDKKDNAKIEEYLTEENGGITVEHYIDEEDDDDVM
jgi:hypothetical protein